MNLVRPLPRTACLLLTTLVAAAPSATGAPAYDPLDEIDSFNVVWASPSANSAGSMPLGNGDIGVNAWVESGGDLLLLLAKTDAWSENGRLLKLGRVRVSMNPSPFASGKPFKQELVIRDGAILITAGDPASEARLRIWVDAENPVVRIEAESDIPRVWQADLELWRNAPRTLTGGELNSAYGIINGPNPVVVQPDTVVAAGPGQVVWYHRNASSIWADTLTVQSLGHLQASMTDPLLNRTFGAAMVGDGFTAVSSQRLVSDRRATTSLTIVPHTAITATAGDWQGQLNAKLAAVETTPSATRFSRHCDWWHAFWRRHWLVVAKAGPPAAPSHVTATASPFTLGADNTGGSRFNGKMSRVSLYRAALDGAAIQQLAATPRQQVVPDHPNLLAAWRLDSITGPLLPAKGDPSLALAVTGTLGLTDDGGGNAVQFAGGGYLRTPDQEVLDLVGDSTLEAWIAPGTTSGRIIDKGVVGTGEGYVLDTYPGNDLRLITKAGNVFSHDANLAPNTWVHVAAVIDSANHANRIYVNGTLVATQSLDSPAASDEFAVTQGYLLQRFVTACAGRGAMPVKFNGSLFTVDATSSYDADYRQWGPCYWWQNTRLPYWAMPAAGDFELMEPLFKMYRDALPLARERVSAYYGHAGAYFPETMYFWGTWNNDNYGWDRAGKPPGLSDNRYIRWEWQGGIELVWMMLTRYRMTADAGFATGTLLPLAQEIIDLYDLRFPRDPDGRLRFNPAQALETYWDCQNPAPEVSGLRQVLTGLLALPDDLTTASRRSQWMRLLGELPPLATRTVSGQTAISPAEVIGSKNNTESPELYPVFPYEQFKVGKPDLALAQATYQTRVNPQANGWGQDVIFAAMLGLTDDAKTNVVRRFKTKHSGSRFPVMWGPNFDWIPDQDHGGVNMIALQKMALQENGSQIQLFPAWPADWNLKFRFHASGNTTLDGEYKDGAIIRLNVVPASRRSDVTTALGAIPAVTAARFYMAPDGDDGNSGSASEPFATLERARQAVRTVNDEMTGEVVVELAPGDYPMAVPVEFNAADSGHNGHPVIYRASGTPGSARLVGGERVTNWQPWQGEIVFADLGLPVFHTLYENGRRARKARFPNWVPDPALPLARADYLRATGNNGSYRQLHYAAGALDPTGWDLAGAQVHLWPGGNWAWFTDTVPIAALDPATRTITLADEARYPIYQNSAGSRFFVQGVLALLDEPGEFHYDEATGRLYYWPMDGPAAAQDIIVPRARRILSLTGGSAAERVHDLRFEGLGIEFTDFTGWYRHAYPRAGDSGVPRLYPQFDRQATLPQHREAAVVLENTESITFDACVIRNTGYSGVASFGANRHNSFQRCWLSHTGVHGLHFEGLYPGEGDVQTLNTVDNCLVQDVGELAGQGAGVQLTNASHHEISHCVIDRSPRYAVSLNAYVDIPLADIYVHSNHTHHIRISNCCQDSGDTAPVYAWGLSDDAPYHVNSFEQLLIDDTLAHPSMPDIVPNGVFLDNDTFGQQLTDIDVRNSQGAAFRVNSSSAIGLTNVSWQAGFDPARIDYDTIGVRADHPFAVAPARLTAIRASGETSLSWLPVANAASYAVLSAAAASGPWAVLATGLTVPAFVDTTVPPAGLRYYRVVSIGPGGEESEPSAAAAVFAQAPGDSITFETDQGYPQATGTIAGVRGNPDDSPFSGINGWSLSTGDNSAQTRTAAASGEYPGGQAIGASGSGTYVGGIPGSIEVTGANTISFDAPFGSNGTTVCLIKDNDGDGLFDQGSGGANGDTGMTFGIGGTPARFSYRNANYGTSFYGAGYTGTAGHWYRFLITIAGSVGGNRAITMAVHNLTTGADFDFDAAAQGIQPWNFTVTDAQFGPPPELADGIGVRVTSTARIDNLRVTAIGTPYENWITGFPSLAGDDRAPAADPDHDNIDNLLEFVLNGDPAHPDPAFLPRLAVAGDQLVLAFDRRSDSLATTTLFVEYGTDLAGWASVPIGAEDGSSGDVSWTVEDAGDLKKTTVAIPMGAEPRIFARLKAAEKP